MCFVFAVAVEDDGGYVNSMFVDDETSMSSLQAPTAPPPSQPAPPIVPDIVVPDEGINTHHLPLAF